MTNAPQLAILRGLGGNLMFATDLICSNGHKFEAWFSNHAMFELQRDEELITCPHCGDQTVKQILSPLCIKKHANSETSHAKPKSKADVMDPFFKLSNIQ